MDTPDATSGTPTCHHTKQTTNKPPPRSPNKRTGGSRLSVSNVALGTCLSSVDGCGCDGGGGWEAGPGARGLRRALLAVVTAHETGPLGRRWSHSRTSADHRPAGPERRPSCGDGAPEVAPPHERAGIRTRLTTRIDNSAHQGGSKGPLLSRPVGDRMSPASYWTSGARGRREVREGLYAGRLGGAWPDESPFDVRRVGEGYEANSGMAEVLARVRGERADAGTGRDRGE